MIFVAVRIRFGSKNGLLKFELLFPPTLTYTMLYSHQTLYEVGVLFTVTFSFLPCSHPSTHQAEQWPKQCYHRQIGLLLWALLHHCVVQWNAVELCGVESVLHTSHYCRLLHRIVPLAIDTPSPKWKD